MRELAGPREGTLVAFRNLRVMISSVETRTDPVGRTQDRAQ
jgi:hypothetical protein